MIRTGVIADEERLEQSSSVKSLGRAGERFWEGFWAPADVRFLLQENPLELLLDAWPFLSTARPRFIWDIGCGEGRNLQTLASLDSASELTGFDKSTNALTRVRESRRGVARGVYLNLVSGDCKNIPASSGSVDLLLASDLLNHLPSLSEPLEEFARVLRPGGVLVCNPLSLNDPAFSFCTRAGLQQSPSTFAIFPYPESEEWYIMNFADRRNLEQILCRDFDLVLPLEEKVRRDPPHAYPFRQEVHEHVYWQVVCRRR